jgi:predicted ArsR family transcriptional regulator
MMIFDHIRARSSDPITSFMAADAAPKFANKHVNTILECLAKHGPLGKDGIAQHTGLDGVQISRRLPELQKDGLVMLTGKTVKSSTGNQEREWRLAIPC